MFFSDPSNTAGRVEDSFLFILGVSVLLLLTVTFAMLLFVFRYNRRRHPRPEEVRESNLLEVIWTVVPVLLALGMFYSGWTDFAYLRTPPEKAMPVMVTGRQWAWSFSYENKKQDSMLRVPVGRSVRLILTSEDVIHGFYIPDFRIKEDAVPGAKTRLWFIAGKPGAYDIFCTEYCGVGHSRMLTKLVAMPAEEFDKWYQARATPVGRGMEILTAKGCLACHSTEGTSKVGPTFKGLFGTKVSVVTGGKEREVVADDGYLRRSVLKPEADIVKGYPPVMPVIPVTPEELKEITDYIRSLR